MNNVTIVVVEGSASACEAFHFAFEHLGYQSLSATNYETGLDLLASTSPEILLVDNDAGFPLETFFPIVRSLRPKTQIVMMSRSPEVKADAERLGVFHTLQKPFELYAADDLFRRLLIPQRTQRDCVIKLPTK